MVSLVKSLLDTPLLDSSRILRLNVPVKRCPGVIWLLGTYLSKVWSAGEGEVCAAELFGFMKFKFKTAKLGTLAQMETVSRYLQKWL